jgi:hypothetical protein
VPKLLWHDADEQLMLTHAGLGYAWLPWVGGGEIGVAVFVLATWRWRSAFVLQGSLMLAALAIVAFQSPEYLTHAFNPVTLNLLMLTLATIGWIAADDLPTASHCIRVDPRRLRFEPGKSIP